MQPYIKSIDTSTLLGHAVKNYGDKKFDKGFACGLCTGITVTLIVSYFVFRKGV
jgi:hypothetical protein